MPELNILGGSQTFFGVLATTIILCVIFSSSNFILEILKYIKKEVKSYLDNEIIETNLSLRTTIAKYSTKMKIYARGVDTQNKEQKVIELYDELGLEEIRFFNKSRNLANTISSLMLTSKEEEGNKKIIEKEEKVAAPFYTFIFCLVVFLIDEIFIFESIRVYTTTFLFIFLVLSTIFGSLQWWFYWCRTSFCKIWERENSDKNNNFDSDVTKPIAPSYRNIKTKDKIPVFVVVTVLFMICMCLYIFLIYGSGVNSPKLYLLFVVVSCFVSIVFVAYPKTKCFFQEKDNYSKMFVLRHFIYIFITALVIFFILLFGHYVNDKAVLLNLFLDKSNLRLLVLFILAYVSLNGLILPLTLPIMRHLKNTSDVKAQLEKLITDTKDDLAKKDKEVGKLIGTE